MAEEKSCLDALTPGEREEAVATVIAVTEAFAEFRKAYARRRTLRAELSRIGEEYAARYARLLCDHCFKHTPRDEYEKSREELEIWLADERRKAYIAADL